MIKDFILPSPRLREFIDRYWFWESEEQEQVDLPEIFPSSGIEFTFHYKTPFTGFPRTHLLCPRTEGKFHLNQSGAVGFISVRFKCWAFPYFSNIPVDQIKDNVIDAGALWPKTGKALEEQIINAPGISEKARILNLFFESLLLTGQKRSAEIDWAINHLYYHFNHVSIAEIIEECNLSPRTFQRKFKQAAGVNAKNFQKIVRFEKTLKQSLLGDRYPGIDLLLGAGYYDQAHFNKDFNFFTGKNPTELLSAQKNMAHFYNTSLPK